MEKRGHFCFAFTQPANEVPVGKFNVVVIVGSEHSELRDGSPFQLYVGNFTLAVIELARTGNDVCHHRTVGASGQGYTVQIEGVLAYWNNDTARYFERFDKALILALGQQTQRVAGLVLEFNPKFRRFALQTARQTLDPLDCPACIDRPDIVAGWAMGVAEFTRRIADIASIQIPKRRIEVSLDLLYPQSASEPGAVRHPETSAPGAIVSIQSICLALLIPKFGFDRSSVRKTRVLIPKIDPCETVVRIRLRVPVRDDEAHGGFLQDVGRHPADEEIPGLDTCELILLDRQRPHVPAAQPSAEFAAGLQIHGLAPGAQSDGARKERPGILGQRTLEGRAALPLADAAELKDVRVLQEEIALFGEKQTETSQIDLPIVHFGGREIGIQGE